MTRTSDATNPMPIHKVGFIGLGIMGKSIAGHLLVGGHELHVFNSSRAKADDLLARVRLPVIHASAVIEETSARRGPDESRQADVS
jgi:6-phosphogluconate dehydrogenase